MEAAISQVKPDLIVAYGLSESVPKPRVEAYGWNYGASGKDAAGIAKNGLLIETKDARVGFKTTFDYKHVEQWLVGSGFEAYYSDDAGDFLCNANIYYAMNALQNAGLQVPYMFVHVPSFTTMAQSKQEEFAKIIIQKALAEMNINIKIDDLKAGGNAGGSEPVSPEPVKPVDPTPEPVKIDHGLLEGVSDNNYTARTTNTRYRVKSPLESGYYVFEGGFNSMHRTGLEIIMYFSDGDTKIPKPINLKLGYGASQVKEVIKLDQPIYSNAKFNIEYKNSYETGNMTIISNTIKLYKEGKEWLAKPETPTPSESEDPLDNTDNPTEDTNAGEADNSKITSEIESNLISNASANDYTKEFTALSSVTYRTSAILPKERINYLFKFKGVADVGGKLTVSSGGYKSDEVAMVAGEKDYEILVYPVEEGRSWDRANMTNAIALNIAPDAGGKLTIKGGSVEFGKLVDQAYTPK